MSKARCWARWSSGTASRSSATRNVPSRLAADASALYSRNLFNFLSAFWDKEAGKPVLDEEIGDAVRLTQGGKVVNARLTQCDRILPVPGRIRSNFMDFISILSIFVLACFVGYYVVWSVTPALHTPLMAVTNAISSVIIVGALIAARRGGERDLEMARADRGGAGQHQHLRRLRGHRADAGDVQEERTAGGRQK